MSKSSEFVEKSCVKVSELEGSFYEEARAAMQQVPDAPKMYEIKSLVGYLGGGALGMWIAIVLPLLMCFRFGGDYMSFMGVFFLVPMLLICFFGYLSENYRFKWKKGMRFLLTLAKIASAVIFSAIFIFGMLEYLMTEYEKLVLCMAVFAPCFITQSALSRTEEYLTILRDILGFKQFIMVTEEDKIKVMLEENPQLYYKVLPYAQVLGVTSEWEDKFKGLILEPPTWYAGTPMMTGKYYLLHRSMNRAMYSSMARAVASGNGGTVGRGGRVGGTTIGRSGGGGRFGGFGGGGFGGGGFGAR